MKIFKMALLCIFMGLAGMGLAIPAAAQGADDTPLSTGYASVEDVPLILLQEMRSEMSRERFISQVLGPLRNHGEDRNALRKETIEKLEQEGREQEQRRFFAHMISYDLNFDGQVTRAELEEHFEKLEQKRGRSGNVDTHLKKIMEADADGDGVLTLKEMSEPPPLSRHTRASELAELLALDPNKDGILHSAELLVLAESAFDLVDVYRDTLLSKKEVLVLRKAIDTQIALRNIREGVVQGTCNFSKVDGDAEVIFLATYHGDVSSVGFGEEKSEVTYTNTVTFSAELSRKKYLVLLSSRPMVWHLENVQAHLSQVVVVGPASRVDKTVHAGVLGVEDKKVSFVPLECFPKVSEATMYDSAQFEETQAYLKAHLSHETIIVKEMQEDERAEIADGKVYIQTRPVENTLLAGFDPRIWRDYIEKGRDRIRIFDSKETAQIISLAKVTPYAVYPRAFGLAQLVHQGVLEPIENGTEMTIFFDSLGREMPRISSVEKLIFSKEKQGSGSQVKATTQGVHVIRGYDYKIVKPLVAYPQDVVFFLDGKFILTKNGALPKGLVLFCIVDEETGKQVQGSFCR